MELLGAPPPVVGRTPKTVLHRRGTLELVHYSATVDEVYRVPLLFVMAPTFDRAWRDGMQPLMDNAMPQDRLADAARALGMRVEIAGSVDAALRTLANLAYDVPPRILITGSLYLAGHVLALNGTPPG